MNKKIILLASFFLYFGNTFNFVKSAIDFDIIKENYQDFKNSYVAAAIGTQVLVFTSVMAASIGFLKVMKMQQSLAIINSGIVPKKVDIVLNKNMKDIATSFEQELKAGLFGTHMLFYGSPGNGKTLFAEYLAYKAYECNSNSRLFLISPSEIVKPIPGAATVSPSEKLSSIFSAIKIYAQSHGPAIVLFDEVDFAAKRRDGPGVLEERALVAEFLINISECKMPNLFLIGATNYPEAIDMAMLRDGRFGSKVVFKNPSLNDSKNIIKKSFETCEKIKFSDKHLDILAQKAKGLSRASLVEGLKRGAILMIPSSIKDLKNNSSLLGSARSWLFGNLGLFVKKNNKSENQFEKILKCFPETINMDLLVNCLIKGLKRSYESQKIAESIRATQLEKAPLDAENNLEDEDAEEEDHENIQEAPGVNIKESSSLGSKAISFINRLASLVIAPAVIFGGYKLNQFLSKPFENINLSHSSPSLVNHSVIIDKCQGDIQKASEPERSIKCKNEIYFEMEKDQSMDDLKHKLIKLKCKIKGKESNTDLYLDVETMEIIIMKSNDYRNKKLFKITENGKKKTCLVSTYNEAPKYYFFN